MAVTNGLTAADNTARNVRDRAGDTLTPADQSETEADRGISQNIRKAIMADESLSVTAKNIKIITVNGVVTLRGPVNSEQERDSIAEKARAVGGVQSVVNQLEVKQG
jgi:osmotically-inducible protein OsmY